MGKQVRNIAMIQPNLAYVKLRGVYRGAKPIPIQRAYETINLVIG